MNKFRIVNAYTDSRTAAKRLLGSLLVLLLVACGGGGGGGGGTVEPPAPPPPPPPPAFEQVSEATGAAELGDPRLAFMPSGDGAAAWIANGGTHTELLVSRYSAADGGWSPPEVIASVDGDTASYELDLAANDDAVAIAWIENVREPSVRYRVHATVLRDTGFDAPSLLGEVEGEQFFAAELRLAGGGTQFALIWRQLESVDPVTGDRTEAMRGSLYDAGTASWSAGTNLHASGQNTPGWFSAQRLVSNGSTFLAAWVAEDSGGTLAVNHTANGTWQSQAVVVDSGIGYSRDLAVASNGDDYRLAWKDGFGLSAQLVTGHFSPALVQSPNVVVADGGSSPGSPSLVSNGDSYLLTWRHYNGSESILSARQLGATQLWVAGDWPALGGPLADFGAAANGETYAVYMVQYDSADPATRAFSYSASVYGESGWSAMTYLDDSDSRVTDGYLAGTGSGFAAVWIDETDNANDEFALKRSDYANGSWTPAADMQPGTEYPDDVALRANGDLAIAAWARQDADVRQQSIFAAAHDGSWQAAVDIDGDARGASVFSQLLASNAAGETAYAWEQLAGTTVATHVAVRSAAGTWGEAAMLPGAEPGSDVRVVGNAQGFAAFWNVRYHQNTSELFVREYRAGAWQDAVSVNGGPNREVYNMQAAAADDSYAVLFRQFADDLPGTQATAHVVIGGNGSWGAPQQIGDPTQRINDLAIASDGSGYMAAMVTWSGLSVSEYNGSWGSAAPLSAGDIGTLHMLSDGSRYAALWSEQAELPGGDEINTVYGSVSDPDNGNAFGTPAQLSDNDVNAFVEDAVATPALFAVVVSQRDDSGPTELLARTWTDGDWTALASIEDSAHDAMLRTLAADGDRVAVLWAPWMDEGASLHANVYEAGSWGGSAMLATDADADLNGQLQLASDGSSFTTAYATSADVPRIEIAAYSDGSWETGELPTPAGASDQPLVTFTGSDYLATWRQASEGSLVRLPWSSTTD